MHGQCFKGKFQMLQKQVVSEKTFALLQKLQSIPELKDLRLVGGTALALQIGHRISIDLDLFGQFDTSIPLEMLLTDFDNVVKTGSNKFMQFFEIDGIKVDFVNYPYQWLKDPIIEEGVTLASIEDIAAMKINAIINRGTKKDFIDMAFLLEQFSLSSILELYKEKYTVPDFQLALRSLSYFDDAETDAMPIMIQPKDWATVKNEIITALREYK